MKKLHFLTASLIVSLFQGITNNVWASNEPHSSKAQSVNSVTGDASFVQKYGIQPAINTDEYLRLQTHLEYVEGLLRSKDVNSLSKQLQQQRAGMLGLLHEYWTNGSFPKNYDYPGERKSCFIDKNGTICAVGYLVEQTAGIEVAQKINSVYQYAKIYEMNMPELDEWIANSGLTKEECAMIQPAYGYYGVDSMKVMPCLPASNDEIMLIVYNNREVSSSFPTRRDLQLVGNNNINLDHYQGLPFGLISFGPVHVIDTFYINPLPTGQYDIKYNFLTYMLPPDDSLYPGNHLRHTASIKFNVGTFTSNDDLSTCQSYLHAYPNPSDGHFRLLQSERMSDATTDVRVFDLTGREIKRTILSSGEINAELDYSDLKAGTYFYSVYAKDATISSKKLVIIK